MSMAAACSRLESFLWAGVSFENRGGRHDPLDDDIRIALDAWHWHRNPSDAATQEIDLDDPNVVRSVISDLLKRPVDMNDPLEKDIRRLATALKKAYADG